MQIKTVKFDNGDDFAVIQQWNEYQFVITFSIAKNLARIPLYRIDWRKLKNVITDMMECDTQKDEWASYSKPVGEADYEEEKAGKKAEVTKYLLHGCPECGGDMVWHAKMLDGNYRLCGDAYKCCQCEAQLIISYPPVEGSNERQES